MKNKNVYLAPAIQVKKIAVENGFQMSIAIIESLSDGSNISF
jgi:hypothetical protein